jgi:hypothetical protein
MTTVTDQRAEAEKLRSKAALLDKDTEKHQARSASYSHRGEMAAAARENALATASQQQSMDLQQQAVTHDQTAQQLEQEIMDLERQQNDIRSVADAQIDKLEMHKRALQ